MKSLIQEYNIEFLPPKMEIDRLAKIYVKEKIIPEKYFTDALHIAAATVHGIDIITSWNFKHIVKMKTITQTEIINMKEGYTKNNNTLTNGGNRK